METLIVWVIIGIAALATGRALYRALSGKAPSCGCGSSCNTCPTASSRDDTRTCMEKQSDEPPPSRPDSANPTGA